MSPDSGPGPGSGHGSGALPRWRTGLSRVLAAAAGARPGAVRIRPGQGWPGQGWSGQGWPGQGRPARTRPAGPGLLLTGIVWPGGDAQPAPGEVLVDPGGTVEAVGLPGRLTPPAGVRRLTGVWIGPAPVDAHVHLAFGSPAAAFGGGLCAVRDLGAALPQALGWQTPPGTGAPGVAVAGPLLTAPDGYPSRSWGPHGVGWPLSSPRRIAQQIRQLSHEGVDLVKLALEPAGGAPVPDLEQARAVVRAAHEHGLAVSAHALSVAMVERALDAGVDELAHCPVEPLPGELVDRIAAAQVQVVSTLQAFFAGGNGRGAAQNAAALHAAGVVLLYGSDLGNDGTHDGVDPRELDRLASAGLGRLGALRAATRGSAGAAGLRGRGGDGTITVGRPARLVALATDPLQEPAAWRHPVAVVAAGTVRLADGADPHVGAARDSPLQDAAL